MAETDLSRLASQTLFEPLRPWLMHFDGNVLPAVAALNACVDAQDARLRSGDGVPLRFVPPGSGVLPYEERAFLSGEVETRPHNWHDFFNALVWLVFPRAKAALNARHYHALQVQRQAGCSERSALRDAATQFDESGVVVVSVDAVLLGLLRQHRWKELFFLQRAAVSEAVRIFVFGHALYDKLRAPYVGLCGKALLLDVSRDWPTMPLAWQIQDVDRMLAGLFTDPTAYVRPRDFQPLPLLGIPGVVRDSEKPSYYDDTRQFRPPRRG